MSKLKHTAGQENRSSGAENRAQEELSGIVLNFLKVASGKEDKATQILGIIESNGYDNDVCIAALIAMSMSDNVREGDYDTFKGKGTFERALEIYEKSMSTLKGIKGFAQIAYIAQLLSENQVYRILYQPRVKLNIHIPNCEGCGQKLTYRCDWLTFGKNEVDIELDCTNKKCNFDSSIYNSFRNMIRLTMV